MLGSFKSTSLLMKALLGQIIMLVSINCVFCKNALLILSVRISDTFL